MSTATGLDSPESQRVAGVALSFPANDDDTTSSCSPGKIPRRLRRRLLERKSPATAEEIDAKLKEADLRRQQYYELLSSKARLKPKSFLPGADLAERLNAKLNAAEEKRLHIIAKEQMRLARLDELRQAAKTGAEMRFEKERDELGLKVESRIQKAHTNRMLLLKAYQLRRAAERERAAQSLTRKMVQESKYKECVRSAINQKRAAAERKRLGLLEARARVAQVRDVAKSLHSQREMDRRRMKDTLEHRLQRAKKQRTEYLRQRRNLQNALHASSNVTGEQWEFRWIKLARCWRQFVRLKKTTFALAKAYEALGINERSAKSMPFEQLALLLESAKTIKSMKALLDRLETRLRISCAATGSQSSLENIDHLLKRVASPNQREFANFSAKGRDVKAPKSRKEFAQGSIKLSRYPVRVVLCAYMILGHPEAVFNGKGEPELALADSAANFIREFELLIKTLLVGPIQTDQGNISSSNVVCRVTFRSQLKAFDKAWCSYLYCFVAWKVRDAKLLEGDLVRAACQMELSMMKTRKLSPGGGNTGLSRGLIAIQRQVLKDQNLLREKVQHLSGDVGLQHMERALSDARSRFSEEKKSEDPIATPGSVVSSLHRQSPLDGAAVSVSDDDHAESRKGSNQTVRSLFERGDSSPAKKTDITTLFGSSTDGHLRYGELLVSENELLVNEIVHGHCHSFADILNVGDEDQNTLKAKVRETMERAFWDSLIDSMKQDEPDFEWVLKLMTEVRDELCEMSPQSWKQEIVETIDIDFLSKVLRSGNIDMDYFGKMLEFALVTLRKLSATASDDEMKTTHNQLLKELREISITGDRTNSSFALLMIKGLRFILQEIQTLKREISKARMKIVEPLIKGPAGLEYLRKAFADRYGPPTDADTALPLTKQWLSSVGAESEQEWNEYKESLSAVTAGSGPFLQGLPPTILRTGGNTPVTSKVQFMTSSTATVDYATGNEQLECNGGRVDMMVRLGLLKLVSKVEGLALENLPETMKLNLSRLRTAQAQLQKIIVISTSILVLRQTLLSEKLVTSTIDMESSISQCFKQLSELLDNIKDAGTSEITETLSQFLEGNTEKHEARKQIAENMLVKSLQAGDAIFTRVSRAIYLAARGVVFGGSGIKGRQLAEMELRRLGAVLLTDKVVEVAEMLVVVANVSCSVHGAWYEQIVKNL